MVRETMQRLMLAGLVLAMTAAGSAAQVRTAAPKVVNASDAMSFVNSGMGFVQTALPFVIQLAYFLVVVAILLKLWRARKQGLGMMELIGLGIMFGLMRG
jgi:hypothetical protein